MKVSKARYDLEAGDPAKAARILEPLANHPGDDQILYLLDYASALQMAGQYQKSFEAFEKADKLAVIQDYHSISRIAGSLALSEEMVQYKVDPFEALMIDVLQAINFALMGKTESALVEVRQIDLEIKRLRGEGLEGYEENPFSTYLSALIWEDDRKFDDTYIALEETYRLLNEPKWMVPELHQAALKADRPNKAKKWMKLLPDKKKSIPHCEKCGELVLVFLEGWVPRKAPNPAFPRLPELRQVSRHTTQAELTVNETTLPTQLLFDIEATAMATMNAAYTALAAKRMAGIASKALISERIRKENKALGELAWIAMNVADRADLRQWSTLPARIQVARLKLESGTHSVQIRGRNEGGGWTTDLLDLSEVSIKPRKKTFVLWRGF